MAVRFFFHFLAIFDQQRSYKRKERTISFTLNMLNETHMATLKKSDENIEYDLFVYDRDPYGVLITTKLEKEYTLDLTEHQVILSLVISINIFYQLTLLFIAPIVVILEKISFRIA